MTAARPAIGSPCRSSGGRAVTLYLKAPRHCDADPVANRAARRLLAGADFFNGRPAQVDALKRSAGSCAGSCAAVNSAKREIDARPSTFSFAAEAGKADPRSKPGMNRSSHLAKSVSAKSGSRSSARPAESTFPGNGARGPGVAAFKSTAAAPVFNSASNVHGALFARRAFINASRLLRE